MNNQKMRRKYINGKERDNFIKVSRKKDMDLYLFCWMLFETGCRISECLALAPVHIDAESNYIYIKSLKKRKKSEYRRLPVSRELISALMKFILLTNKGESDRLWAWSRMTAYRRLKLLMTEAQIPAHVASPKALRHGFAIAALESGIPISLVQRWLGHADLKTTAIYTELLGEEEKKFASRLWAKAAKPAKCMEEKLLASH